MTEPVPQQQPQSLFEAITQGPAAVVAALLAGADKNAKNDQGQTASEVAPSNDIASIIQSWPEQAFDVPQALALATARLTDLAGSKERSTKACEEWVKAVTERRDAKVADLLRQVQEAESEAALNIEQAEQTRNLEVEALNRTEEAVQELARGLSNRSAEFQQRASRNLTALSESEVVALFRAVRIDVDETKLKGITGEILAEIQEGDVEPYLGIRALGPRRRLMGSIRKLKQHNPFSDLHVPSTTVAKEGDALPAVPYTWNISQVTEWLRKEGLSDLIQLFRDEQITGDVLMDISGADLRTMGVQQLGPRIMCERKIAELRKPFVEPNIDAPMSAEQVQTILRQHADVEKQLSELSERNSARLIGDTRTVPTDFLCPITRGIMEDPVIAADTLTYERVAIEAWFIEHETSPITRQVIQKTLIPNAALRRMITQFIDDRPL